MTVRITPFTNDSGKTIETEILRGYYYNMTMAYREGYTNAFKDERIADALFTVEGKFNFEANKNQMFVIRATTTAESEAGLYRAEIS